MKKNITEGTSTVNAEQPAMNNEEFSTVQIDEEQTVQLVEAESLATSKNVIKTRH
jgi:hypothetical protein